MLGNQDVSPLVLINICVLRVYPQRYNGEGPLNVVAVARSVVLYTFRYLLTTIREI